MPLSTEARAQLQAVARNRTSGDRPYVAKLIDDIRDEDVFALTAAVLQLDQRVQELFQRYQELRAAK